MNSINFNCNNKNVNFTAHIPDDVRITLYRQVQSSSARPQLRQLLKEKLKKVEIWGVDDLAIVQTKNIRGKHCLGLSVPINADLRISCPFNNLQGRTELSQFLALTAAHIINTEITIQNMYKKYGFGIFKKMNR